MAAAVLLGGCGLDTSGITQNQAPISAAAAATAYAVQGTVTGLGAGASMVLHEATLGDLIVAGNGTFRFKPSLSSGTAFLVTVTTQPTGETCTVAAAAGTVATSDVSVLVTCDVSSLTLGGKVTGLAPTGQLTLRNGPQETLTVSGGGNGSLQFLTSVPLHGSYSISVVAAPAGESCSVTNGSGADVLAAVSNIDVVCAVESFSLSGTVSGLMSSQQVTLMNGAASDTVTLSGGSGSAFEFPARVPYGGAFSVTVASQPTDERCAVTNFARSGVTANVTSVHVTCAQGRAVISGTLTGLAAGRQVTVLNNAADPLRLTADGGFSFSTPVPFGGDSVISITAQPAGQNCTMSDATHALVAADVTDVSIVCGAATESVVHSFAVDPDGDDPGANLIPGSDGDFYGTTPSGGAAGLGTVFRISPSGVETVLYAFVGGNDGAAPQAALVAGRDGNFYGTTQYGGASGGGTVFMVTPAGIETVLHAFGSGNDGYGAIAALVQGSDGVFYGTTPYGGANGIGTVFEVTAAGTETVLHAFAPSADGYYPQSALIQAPGGTLYGTTSGGGDEGNGTVFAVATTGALTVLYSFTGGSDGAAPTAPLIQASNGSFYGTSTASRLRPAWCWAGTACSTVRRAAVAAMARAACSRCRRTRPRRWSMTSVRVATVRARPERSRSAATATSTVSRKAVVRPTRARCSS
jgi:uncharacterized repeat protein (TIGR03803 family)